MPTHYHLEGSPACGHPLNRRSIPASNPKQCSCIDCAFKMVAESDTVKQMEAWMLQFQDLRKAVVWYENRKKEQALWEEMRIAPLSVSKSQPANGAFRADTDYPIPGGPAIRNIEPPKDYPFTSTVSTEAWDRYGKNVTADSIRRDIRALASSQAVDLWYTADIGVTCNLPQISQRLCAAPAIEISTDQFGLPISRCITHRGSPV